MSLRSLAPIPLAAIYCAAILGALALGPACAQSPTPADEEQIAACLQSQRDAERDGHDCIGRIADKCLDAPDGQSTLGMVQCLDRETKVWDEILNDEYNRLLGALPKAAADSVRSAERAWLATRDADCHVAYDIFEGGTMAQPIAARCMLDHVGARALQLRDWRELAQPK